MDRNQLRNRLRTVGRRVVLYGTATGLVWGVAVASAVLLCGAWLDLLWELSPQGRIATLALAGLAGIGVAASLAAAAAGHARLVPVARRLDRTGTTGGAILTGLELDAPAGSPGARVGLTAGLAQLAVGRASVVAAGVPVRRAVPARPLGHSLGVLGGLAAVVGLLVLLMPGLALTEWNRFLNPFGDEPPFSQLAFDVKPGNVEVVYGHPLEIDVTISGGEVDQLELILEGKDGPEPPLPMFPEPGGKWRAVLAKVTAPADYHVRAFRARSRKYRIGVITVPQLGEVRFRIAPPEYTGLGPYEGPLPKGGIAGLPCTKVRVWAASNRPLSGGAITLIPADGGTEPQELPMRPAAWDPQQAVGEFEVTADARFELRVTDEAGQPSQESFAGTITLLADQRPFIRLLKPQRQSLATPHVALPVSISAEDDYGVSRVQLFRSLNDSRPMPMDVRFEARPRRPVYEQLYLPLSEYGLEPGDVIKLFGRVEDNDPAGAKGAESAVATVRIISQEEFERMLRIRQGLEVMLSKYAEARRRLEGLSKEIEGLRKRLDGQAPDAPLDQATREQAGRTLKRLLRESEALKELAKLSLPYDMDKNLGPQLETLGGMTDEMADALAKLLEESDLDNEALKRQLDKLIKKLGADRKAFEQQVSVPMELLAVIFPLVADQSRFVELVLHELDVAERLSALKGRDGEDSPALKTRMRELEEEQRSVRQRLGELLDDIEDHVARLPDEARFDGLRETAAKFARDVRLSGAIEAMAAAETGLAEFSGTTGYEKAKEAADILQKFLNRCEGEDCMGSMACESLIFQPGLGNCLGNTIAQLLAEMGLSPGAGMGTGVGSGAGGGFSARRSGMSNFGLYGGLPGMVGAGEGDFGEGSGQGDEPARGGGGPGGRNPDQDTLADTPAADSAGGAGQVVVPPQYRRRVGEYFQRVAEEVGER